MTIKSYAAFTLTGFDDQERNLMFVKTDFQVLKLKFHACSMKQTFYPLYKQNIEQAWQQENTFLQAFLSVPGCQTCMCKRAIKVLLFWAVLNLWQKFYAKEQFCIILRSFISTNEMWEFARSSNCTTN